MVFEAIIMFLAVLILLGLAMLCARLAKSRGRDPITWGIIGFFFNVPVLVVLLLIPRRKDFPERKAVAHYLAVLILTFTAATTMGTVASQSLFSEPDLSGLVPTVEGEPYQINLQGNANDEQPDLSGDLYGIEVDAGELPDNSMLEQD